MSDSQDRGAYRIAIVALGCAVLSATEKSTQWQALAGASAGALIGILAPSPTKAAQ